MLTLARLSVIKLLLLPPAHATYDYVPSLTTALYIPLIMVFADIRRVVRQNGRILPAFKMRFVAPCAGTLLICYIVHLKSIGVTGVWKFGAPLDGPAIVGAENFVAITDASEAQKDIFTAVIAVDNIVISR